MCLGLTATLLSVFSVTHVLVVGDSISNGDRLDGTVVTGVTPWPQYVTGDYSVQNISYAGANTSDALYVEIPPVLSEPPPDIAIVWVGTNDVAENINGWEIMVNWWRINEILHQWGVKTIWGCTMLPRMPWLTPDQEAMREALNDWIRTSGLYNRVLDMDKLLRDPANPTCIVPSLGRDGIHPNEAGAQTIAQYVQSTLNCSQGDVNDDGVVSAVDVQLVINGVLFDADDEFQDIDGDGAVNAVDIQLVINAALGIRR